LELIDAVKQRDKCRIGKKIRTARDNGVENKENVFRGLEIVRGLPERNMTP